MPLNAEQQGMILDIARHAIRRALGVASGFVMPQQPDPALLQPAGVFVTLHQRPSHHLRGCVGRLEAVLPLIAAVNDSAEGVLRDPRFEFQRITPAELPNLEIEISVLSPLRKVESPLDFKPLDEGIYLTIGNRKGCFLPQVARETGWTREELLERLCTEKMGLPSDAWKSSVAMMEVFTVQLVGPEPFTA